MEHSQARLLAAGPEMGQVEEIENLELRMQKTQERRLSAFLILNF